MRWFGAIATIGAIIAACSTFDSTTDETPGANDGGGDGGGDATSTEDGGGGSDGGGKVDGGAGGRTVIVLATGQTGITDVAADETYVYWGVDSPGYIRRMRLDASGVTEDLERYSGFGGAPTRIHVDATSMVWGDQQAAGTQGVYVDDLQGSNPKKVFPGAVNDLAVNDDGVVAMLVAADGYVRRFALDGGATLPDLGPYSTPLDVIARGREFLWTGSGEQKVWQLPSDGGSPTIFSDGESDCQRIAKNDEGVYWTRPTNDLVRWRRASGGPANDLAISQKAAYGLAADASGVYWLTLAGEVQKWTSATSKVETIASGQPVTGDSNRRFRTNRLVLTNQYVVWTTDEEIRRVEK